MRGYALFVGAHCRNEKMMPFVRSGILRLLEYTARMVEDQQKFSSQFMEIADFIREAGFWAEKDGHKLVSRDDVTRAARERNYRVNSVEERLHELYENGTIMVDTDGSVAGQ